jgi:hypothetical protein
MLEWKKKLSRLFLPGHEGITHCVRPNRQNLVSCLSMVVLFYRCCFSITLSFSFSLSLPLSLSHLLSHYTSYKSSGSVLMLNNENRQRHTACRWCIVLLQRAGRERDSGCHRRNTGEKTGGKCAGWRLPKDLWVAEDAGAGRGWGHSRSQPSDLE